MGSAITLTVAPQVEELALSWINHDQLARVMIDETFAVLWANSAARSALARRRDLEVRGAALGTRDPEKQAEFEEFVLDAGASVACWCLPRADGDGHLIFRAQRLTWGEGSIFGLGFFSTGKDFRARYADLGAAFGLTRGEGKVLLMLLDGNDAEQIAQDLGVSIETTRSHIKGIYGKLSVNSREALFYRVRPYRMP